MRLSTDPNPDGTYALALSVDDDHAYPLDADTAGFYVAALVKQIEGARYEAAMFAQLGAMHITGDTRLAIIARFRALRSVTPTPDSGIPLGYEGRVNLRGEPFLAVTLDGEPYGQLDVAAAQDHLLGILEGAAVAGLDRIYRCVLTEDLGFTDDEAIKVVALLAGHRDPPIHP